MADSSALRFEGAIFDMDGLLLDTERIFQEEFNKLAAERGITLGPGFVAGVCGSSQTEGWKVIAKHFHTDDPALIDRLCIEGVHARLETEVPLKKGAVEILQRCRKAGLKLAVASSTAMPQVRHNLETAGIDGYFDEIVSGHEVRNGKPAPDVFLLAAERIGADPKKCYVFEDSLNGIRAGHAAGCFTVMIPDCVPPTEEIRAICGGIYDDLVQAADALGLF